MLRMSITQPRDNCNSNIYFVQTNIKKIEGLFIGRFFLMKAIKTLERYKLHARSS